MRQTLCVRFAPLEAAVHVEARGRAHASKRKREPGENSVRYELRASNAGKTTGGRTEKACVSCVFLTKALTFTLPSPSPPAMIALRQSHAVPAPSFLARASSCLTLLAHARRCMFRTPCRRRASHGFQCGGDRSAEPRLCCAPSGCLHRSKQ
jgi:hypothetical protein